MGTLADRISMTTIVVTGLAAFLAMLVAFFIPYESGWWNQPVVIGLIVFAVVVLAAAVWEGFDLMD